ncbi:MAG: Thymidylate kinase [Pelotomaculum sp. PtaB.Bin104]|nr:MAG: Thymidylate kinase [Pelotomaculum sp. PtaB.Bin104]
MRGKLIAIEAGDGCGKKTQTEMLYQRLLSEGFNIKKISFPNYQSSSSSLINMYLSGDFGSEPGAVSPYIASTFYTIDRYASYKKEWENFYLQGGVVLADRYTTANMVHQAAKIFDEQEKRKYLDWLLDFEYKIFQLPVPDQVLFLDVPPEFSHRLLSSRVSRSVEKDIHEQNYDYIVKTYHNAYTLADRYQWRKIECVAGGKLKNIEDIHEQIYQAVKNVVG